MRKENQLTFEKVPRDQLQSLIGMDVTISYERSGFLWVLKGIHKEIATLVSKDGLVKKTAHISVICYSTR